MVAKLIRLFGMRLVDTVAWFFGVKLIFQREKFGRISSPVKKGYRPVPIFTSGKVYNVIEQPKPYLTSISAPASSNCCLIELASSLLTPSLIGFGVLSTRSFASFRPRPVSSFTSFTTFNFAPPGAFRITSNEVFSAAAAPSPPPAGAATATAAAAGSIPYSSLRIFASSLTSFTLRLTSCSANAFRSAMFFEFLPSSRPP